MICLGIAGGYIGYNYGKYISDKEDKTIYLQEFKSEEQLYYILKNEKKPILLYYYVPGDLNNLIVRKFFLDSAKNYNDKIHFMMINCAKNYEFVRHQEFSRIPKVEIMLPEKSVFSQDQQGNQFEQKIFPIISYDNDYSDWGIKAFLEDPRIQILKKSTKLNNLTGYTHHLINYLKQEINQTNNK